MQPIIAVANHKGGTGKTTTVHTLGRIFSLEPYRRGVLMIDMDPQASLTLSCGVTKGGAERANMAHVLQRGREHKSMDHVQQHMGGGLYLAPSHKEMMAETQRELSVRMVGRDSALKSALREVEWPDLILIDCMPGIDILSVNALVAATHVIVPTKPQAVDLGGLGEFLDTLDEIQLLNEDLARLGILLTFFHPRYRLHKTALAGLTAGEEIGGFRVFDTTIGESVKVAEAPGSALTVIDHDPHNPRTAEYQALAREILERLS